MRDPVAAVELAYNIVDALRRHAPQHSDCRAFQEMLAGNMLLAVWMDRCAVVEKLRVGLLLAVSLVSTIMLTFLLIVLLCIPVGCVERERQQPRHRW